MATKLVSISFKNFYNYFGDYKDNTYEFTSGLNIIVADNGGGKSKFFNGILWILENYVLDSDTKKREPIEVAGFKMTSDRAKNLTETGDIVECGVVLKYEDNNNLYEIEKKIQCVKKSNGSPTDKKNWEIVVLEPIVSKKDKDLLKFRAVYDIGDQERIISNFVRPNFRRYALLQGEEVDDIIDFTSKDSLKDAIKTLTNITKFEELIELGQYLSKRAQKDLDEKRRENTKFKQELDKLLRQKDEKQDEIGKQSKVLDNLKKSLGEAQVEREELLNQIAGAKKREEYRQKRESLKSNLESVEKSHEEFQNSINAGFFDDRHAWLLMGTDGKLDDYSKLRITFLEKRAAKKAAKKLLEDPDEFFTELTSDSPDIFSLQRMLDEYKCFVCGTKAEEGSEAYHHIEKVKEHHEKSKIEIDDSAINDFTGFFDGIQSETQQYYKRVNGIIKDISESRKKNQEFERMKQEINQQIEEAEQELIGHGGSDSLSNGSSQDSNIIAKYEGATKRIAQFEVSISNLKQKLSDLNGELKQINKELTRIGNHETPVEYVNNANILGDLSDAIISTKNRFFNEMVDTLEKEANLHFKNLIKGSNADGGFIKFYKTEDETIIINVIDKDGNLILGQSEGFQRMKKLAVVMAIITSSNRAVFNYPFIADAPLSAFGKAFTQGFFNEVPKIFDQSIILVKELYDKSSPNCISDIGNEILKEIKKGTLYLNEIEENLSQVERKTIIKQYK